MRLICGYGSKRVLKTMPRNPMARWTKKDQSCRCTFAPRANLLYAHCGGANRMRVLYVVPYSPFRQHDHAANEMLPQLVSSLATKVELHVYAPGPFTPEELRRSQSIGCELIEGLPPPRRRLLDRLGKRPFWQNAEWSKATRSSVSDTIHHLRPDIVHGDYLQVGDSICHFPSSVLGMHDISTQVTRRLWETSSAPLRVYRYAEYLRTKRLEAQVLRRVAVPIAISPPVLDAILPVNNHAILIRPGVDIPRHSWRPTTRWPPLLLFAGAMWREANASAAKHLIRNVMPIVWRSQPDVILRVAGARPDPELLGLASKHVEITGSVPSLDEEMLVASACIAFTLVGGGLLFKAVRPMALGCPVILNRSVALALGVGAKHGALADTPPEIAAAALRLLADSRLSAQIGQEARRYISSAYSWDRALQSYLSVYESISER